MSFFNLNSKEEPDKDSAFLDALVSMTSDDSSVYVGIGALRSNDVMSAIRVIASDIASNPINATDARTTRLINDNPNEQMSGFSFKFALAVNMLLNGNSFAEIVRNGNGKITSLEFLPNNKITVKQDDESGRVTYNYQQTTTKRRQIAPLNMLHFKLFTRDGVTGVSPLFALKDQLSISKSGNRLLKNFFDKGINGTSVLKVDSAELSSQSKEQIKNSFEQANSGNTSVVVLDDSMELSNLQINTDVLKLVNSNDWTTKQVAEAFGLPIERLGVESEHSNTTQSNVQYLQNTLGHYFDAFTSELQSKLPGKYVFDTSQLFETDPETSQDLAIKGVQAGLLTVNEGRKKIGLAPVDNGDSLLMNVDYIPLEDMNKSKNLVDKNTEEVTN